MNFHYLIIRIYPEVYTKGFGRYTYRQVLFSLEINYKLRYLFALGTSLSRRLSYLSLSTFTSRQATQLTAIGENRRDGRLEKQRIFNPRFGRIPTSKMPRSYGISPAAVSRFEGHPIVASNWTHQRRRQLGLSFDLECGCVTLALHTCRLFVRPLSQRFASPVRPHRLIFSILFQNGRVRLRVGWMMDDGA